MRTGDKVQRAMFLEGLWKQMGRLSAGSHSIVRVAEQYLSEGYDDNEAVELLVNDGFDTTLAKSCVASIIDDAGEKPQWGFEVEDVMRGDLANNFDLGIGGVSGDDEGSSMDEAQAKVDTMFPGQYSVVRVFPL